MTHIITFYLKEIPIFVPYDNGRFILIMMSLKLESGKRKEPVRATGVRHSYITGFKLGGSF